GSIPSYVYLCADCGSVAGDHTLRALPGHAICRQHLLNRCRSVRRRFRQNLLNCTCDAGEGDATFEECCDGDLVGGVEGDTGGGAGLGGLIGQAETGEAGEVRLGEVELGEGSEVEGKLRRGGAFGIGERVEDGQAHVRDGDLGEDGAVDKLHQGVDGGLRVDGDADLCGREVKEAAGFDDLKALVHHGGGVDGDAAAHDPCGML